MNRFTAKISIIILLLVLITACNAVKKVPNSKKLLDKHTITLNGKKIADEDVVAQLAQQPNSNLLGYKLRLNMYNLAKENTDSLYLAKFNKNPQRAERLAKWLSKKQVNRLGKSFWYFGWHNFLRKTGEPPAILDSSKTEKSLKRLRAFYFNRGYFNALATANTEFYNNRKSKIDYTITTGEATFIDSISKKIETPLLNTLYNTIENKALIKSGQQYNTENFENERARITSYFRDKGIYHFQSQNINFEIDTTTKKAPVILNIGNRNIKSGDTTITLPFKQYKIGRVNIFTIDPQNKNKKVVPTDSLTYKNFHVYSTEKLRFRPKALTNAVFIQKDSLYSDSNRMLSLRSLNNLRIFEYPTIQYFESPDSDELVANIYLKAKNKYGFKANADVTHSNIQELGVSGTTSLLIRNLFRGAEVLELGLRGNLGSSTKATNFDKQFFNILEIGADMRLSLPRFLLPFSTESFIPKTMFPSSFISVGFSKQQNIGLDKENFTGITNYSWSPSKNTSAKLDLINIQYVKNINIKNYFNVYKSSYDKLNTLSQTYNLNPDNVNTSNNLTIEEGGADNFMQEVLTNQIPALVFNSPDYNTIKSIKERKTRLTENNLIFASNFTYNKDSKSNLLDKEFYSFKTKLELSGYIPSFIAKLSKQPLNENGSKELFGLAYSQYVKTEFEYIKHWQFSSSKVLAFRSFAGVAIPYGNSKSIPFSRSYFAGGTNDNRAWVSYSLGPGSSKGTNDFNEANMKLAFNTEFRFNLFGSLNGAIFADCGNIWNVLDSETDQTKVFSGIKSLENIALGTGFGLRYDFQFFVIRMDYGFKTYNPSRDSGTKWFRQYRFDEGVFNIGINYPF